VTSGNAKAIRAASLTVIISVPYPYSSAALSRMYQAWPPVAKLAGVDGGQMRAGP